MLSDELVLEHSYPNSNSRKVARVRDSDHLCSQPDDHRYLLRRDTPSEVGKMRLPASMRLTDADFG